MFDPMMTLIFATLSGLFHILFFALESLLWETEKVRKIFKQEEESIKYTKLLAYNQGWYNLFLAIGSITGVVLSATGQNQDMAKTLIVFCNASMVGAALVLISSNKSLYRGAIIQGVPAALALAGLFI